MVKTQHATMTLALGILLLLFSTAFAAAPAQPSGSRTASSPTTSQQFGWSGWSEVPGNGSTLDAPGATAFFNKLYLFVRCIYVNILQIPA